MAGAALEQYDLDIVPTHKQLWTLFNKTKQGRGHGEDCIPPELYKCAAEILSRILLPLHLKATLRIQEPLAWRGGMLAEL